MLKFCLRSDPVIGRPVISDIYFLLIISYFKSFETLNTKQEYKAETGSMQGYCVDFILIPNYWFFAIQDKKSAKTYPFFSYFKIWDKF